MSKTTRISLNFRRMSDKDLVPFGKGVIAGLEENPFFPNIKKPFGEAKRAFEAYVEAIPPKHLRNSANAATKNKLKEVAVLKLKALASFVEGYAEDNREMLESSGFDVVNACCPS